MSANTFCSLPLVTIVRRLQLYCFKCYVCFSLVIYSEWVAGELTHLTVLVFLVLLVMHSYVGDSSDSHEVC